MSVRMPGLRSAAGSAATSLPDPRPASTVAVLRPAPGGPEVLLTRRPATMAFGPSLHVFPGGAVDDGDEALGGRSVLDGAACAAAWAGDLAPGAALRHAVAAVRELHEEAGLLLAGHADGSPVDAGELADVAGAGARGLAAIVERLDLVLRTDLLVPLARWVTPPGETTRRYDARFYVAELPDGAGVAHDEREVAACEWTRPADALDSAGLGRILLWPPTSTTLRWLVPATGLGDVRRLLAPSAPSRQPRAEPVADDIVRVRLTTGGGIPGCEVDCWLIGRGRVVVVDPGDPNDEGAEAILATVAARGGRVAAILATAAVPDHVGGVTGLAIRTGAPVLASPAAVSLIGQPASALANGMEIAAGDTPLRVLELPGDPDGAIVLEVDGGRALLTGDLGTAGPSRGIGMRRGSTGEEAAFLAPLAGRRLPAHA
jgi:glyoxylase-like metal-dependent hydrolase (beta-lactamase superfamily II)/8-oxo-dGTP pyrophosphatase MutT (NUDIX family)